MITPGTYALPAYRYADGPYTFLFRGLDLTGCDLLMEWRLYKGAPGDPLASFANAASPGAEGFEIDVETVAGVPQSTVTLWIDEATINGVLPFVVDEEGRPNRIPPGADVAIKHDLRATFTDGVIRRLIEGPVLLLEGVSKGEA